MNTENKNNPKKYLIVTACKNEAINLSNLIKSVEKQTIRPILWVIVDDGSTDMTPAIIKEAKNKNNWIHHIRLNEGFRDIGLHYANVIKTGFNFAIEYCMKNQMDYAYLGNLDGDLTIEPTFFDNLIKEFEKNPKLGIAGGGVKYIIGNSIKIAKERSNEPAGGNILIRRFCYEECGGIPLSYGTDSVLKAKARLRGWETKRFEENITTEIRDVHSAEGYWNGYFQKGNTSFYINLNPIHIFIKSIIYSFKKPYYIGVAYLLGYLNCIIRRKKQIQDDEIKKYFWNKWKNII